MGRVFVAHEPADNVRAIFLGIARELSEEYAGRLDEERERSKERAAQPGILWDELVTGIVAMQNGASWDRLRGRVDVPMVLGYETLRAIEPERRASHIEAILQKGGVYKKAQKAKWLAENIAKMERRDGPQNALALFEKAPGRAGKIAFLTRFAGVRDKLSRHIPMRLYHPEFRDSIAIDARITNISKLLGLRFRSFDDEEQWYIAAAHDASLDGWILDRVMYHAHRDFTARLERAIAAKEPA